MSSNVVLATTGTALKQWLQSHFDSQRQWFAANERLVALLTQWTNMRQSLRHVDTPVPWGELAQVPGLRDAAHDRALSSLSTLRTRVDKSLAELDAVAATQRDATYTLQTLRDALLARDLASASNAATNDAYLPSVPSACVQRVLAWSFELDASSVHALAIKRLAVEGVTHPLHGALRHRLASAFATGAGAAGPVCGDPALAWLGADASAVAPAGATRASADGASAREVSPESYLVAFVSTYATAYAGQDNDVADDARAAAAAAAAAAGVSALMGGSVWVRDAAATADGAATGASGGAGAADAAALSAPAPALAAAGTTTGGLSAATGELPSESALRAYLSAVSLEPGRSSERAAHVAAAVEQMLRSQLAVG